MQIWEQIQNMAWDVCFVIVLVLLLRPLAGAEGRVASGSTLTEDNTPISDSIWTEGNTPVSGDISAADSVWASGRISTVGNQWGETRFVSCAPSGDENFEDVSFLLEKEGEVIYQFPYYYENNNTADDIGLFNGVEAVGFRDVNQDGLQDVIVIMNYVTGTVDQGKTSTASAARIFVADGEGFYLDTELMDEVADNFDENELSVEAICRYIGNQRAEEILRDGTGSSEGGDKQLSCPAEGQL